MRVDRVPRIFNTMDAQLIAKYDRRVARYTSYPTAPHFHAGVDADVYRGWLAGIPAETPLSLYMHVPFCGVLCWYCGCQAKVVNRYGPVASYLTNLRKELPNSAVALSFDMADMAAYDVFMLEREGSENDYPPEVLERARAVFEAMDASSREELERNIVAGLPGGDGSYDRDGFSAALAEFDGIDSDRMRANLVEFLEAVIPVAEEAGVRMTSTTPSSRFIQSDKANNLLSKTIEPL